MKRILLLMLFAYQAYSTPIVSERVWVSGAGIGHFEKLVNTIEPGEVSKADTYLYDQKGYQGLENHIGATHVFYAYNGTGIIAYHTFTAKLCDSKNNCFHYEKKIMLDWGQYYGETIYSSLATFGDAVGRYPIYADTNVMDYPTASSHKEASLLLSPFPYDP